MRKLALLNLVFVLAIVLAACGPKATEPPPPAPTEPPAEEPGEAIVQEEATPTPLPAVEESQYKQAPMLDGMDLPPVDERLPMDVQVVPVVESIGEYGGTWHGVTDNPGLWSIRMKMYEPPVRWKPDYTGYEPGLAKSWDYSNNDLTITFHFREGVKWSDGEPFTMEDMKFWWEDLAQNDDYATISVPWWARNSDGSASTWSSPTTIPGS